MRLPLTTAIAIQDIPEGLAVAMALKAAGLSPQRAVWIAALSGMMELVDALSASAWLTGWCGPIRSASGLQPGQ